MIPKLRAYQNDTIAQIHEKIDEGYSKFVVCIPTGGGKTTIAASLIHQYQEAKKPVVFLAHRKELVEQARNRLQNFGINPGIIMAGWRQKPEAVNVASVGSLIRREYPAADMLIVDECHHSNANSFRKIIDHYAANGCVVVGLTATPYRADSKGLGDIYQDIIAPITMQELIDQGYLVAPRYFGPKKDFSFLKTTRGEYDEKEMFSAFNRQDMYAGVVGNYLKFAEGTKAIVFNVNVQHSQNTAKAFLEAGISAGHVDGTMVPYERAKVLSDFSSGRLQVLCNVNILTEGYDLPAIETVIINRATKSKSLWFQMVGRGLRPNGDKKSCKVLDHGSNIHEHGPVEALTELTLAATKQREAAIAPVKECPECMLLMAPSCRECPECGYVYVTEERTELVEEFEELEIPKAGDELPEHLKKPMEELSIEELEELRVFKNEKTTWVLRQIKATTMGLPEVVFISTVQTYAQLRNYKPNWIWHALQHNLKMSPGHIYRLKAQFGAIA